MFFHTFMLMLLLKGLFSTLKSLPQQTLFVKELTG